MPSCSIFELVRHFLSDAAFAGQDRTLERHLRRDLLIVDALGMRQLPKRSGEYLFEIVTRRRQVRSPLMTSNRPLENWGELLGDVPAATAFLAPFLHTAEVITIAGHSYHLKDRTAKAAALNDMQEPQVACTAAEK